MFDVWGKPTVSLLENGELIGWAVIEDGYLTHIGVLEDKRRGGTGTKVLQLVFDHMKKNKTRKLNFVNAHHEFWNAMKTKFPKNVKLGPGKELLVVS